MNIISDMHIGIIPDGNRRWCKEKDKKIKELPNIWINIFKNRIIKIIKKIQELKNNKENNYKNLLIINEISLYILSIDNFKKRSNIAVNIIFEIFIKFYYYFSEIYINPEYKLFLENVKFKFIGELDLLPENIKKLIKKLEEKTKNGEFLINIACAYDPFEDLKRMTSEKYHRKQSQIDLLIRTGKEKRLSGFFPYHTLYSEFVFLDEYFPDFNLEKFFKTIDIFKNRNRRFGS